MVFITTRLVDTVTCQLSMEMHQYQVQYPGWTPVARPGNAVLQEPLHRSYEVSRSIILWLMALCIEQHSNSHRLCVWEKLHDEQNPRISRGKKKQPPQKNQLPPHHAHCAPCKCCSRFCSCLQTCTTAKRRRGFWLR